MFQVRNLLIGIGNLLSETIVLITSVIGVGIVVVSRFTSIEALDIKENSFDLIIGLLGLVAASMWIERRKTNKAIEKTNSNLQAAIEMISSNSQVFKTLIEIDGDLSGKILNLAEHHKNFNETRKLLSDPVKKMLDSYMDVVELRVGAYSKGCINIPKHESPNATSKILNIFCNRMDAVSVDDIDFWLSERGKKYLNDTTLKGSRAKQGVIVNRIFVMKKDDFIKRRDDILDILNDQRKRKVGFAIAFEPNLVDIKQKIKQFNQDKTIKDSSISKLNRINLDVHLDFAIFDSKDVVTYFKNYGSPRFIAVFATKNKTHENNRLIKRHREIWVELICECWVVTDDFAKNTIDDLNKIERDQVIHATHNDNIQILHKTNFKVEHKIFPVIINKTDEIGEKIQLAYEVFCKKMEN